MQFPYISCKFNFEIIYFFVVHPDTLMSPVIFHLYFPDSFLLDCMYLYHLSWIIRESPRYRLNFLVSHTDRQISWTV